MEQEDSGQEKHAWKSEGERQIGRWLERTGIRYLYEHPYAFVDRGKVRLAYPDFHLPELGVIIEYAGVNGSKEYEACLARKKAKLEEMGVPALFLNSDTFKGNWPRKLLERLVEIEEVRRRQIRALR